MNADRLVSARLKVSGEMLPSLNLILPRGFRCVCKTELFGDIFELTIEGPFGPSIPDGSEVDVEVSGAGFPHSLLKWQWKFGGKKCGNASFFMNPLRPDVAPKMIH